MSGKRFWFEGGGVCLVCVRFTPHHPPAPPPTPGGGGEHMVHVCGAENVCLLTPLGPLEYVLRSSRGVRNVYLKLTLDCRMAFRATTTKKLRCRF